MYLDINILCIHVILMLYISYRLSKIFLHLLHLQQMPAFGPIYRNSISNLTGFPSTLFFSEVVLTYKAPPPSPYYIEFVYIGNVGNSSFCSLPENKGYVLLVIVRFYQRTAKMNLRFIENKILKFFNTKTIKGFFLNAYFDESFRFDLIKAFDRVEI